MKQPFKPFAALALAAAILMPAYAQKAVPVKDFDVFVDVPSGFAFIKTPTAWRFIRQLDAQQLLNLHPSTLTSLLEPEGNLAEGQPQKDAAATLPLDPTTMAYIP